MMHEAWKLVQQFKETSTTFVCVLMYTYAMACEH